MSIKNSEKFKSFIFETVGSTWSLGLREKQKYCQLAINVWVNISEPLNVVNPKRNQVMQN